MALPRRLGPYRILALLGEGGMGVVYRAEHVETGQCVAVKTARVPYGSEIVGLRSEIHALTRLRHPGVVRIVDEGLTDDLPWYAMELLEGRTLDDYRLALWNRAASRRPQRDAGVEETVPIGGILPDETIAAVGADAGAVLGAEDTGVMNKVGAAAVATPKAPIEVETVAMSRRAPLAAGQRRAPSDPAPPRSVRRLPAASGKLEDVLRLIRRVCSPLAFLHGAGIVHRDIKPSNIFIRDDGTPVLMDFGLVSRAQDAGGREVIDESIAMLGTAAYISPEQILGQIVDARSDLYSLGCILYELVTDQVPFDGKTSYDVVRRHLNDPPLPPSLIVEGVPLELEAIVLRLLAKDPRKRIGHADDLATMLAAFISGRGEAPIEVGSSAYLYRPQLAGRDEALSAFRDLLSATQRGSGRCVLVGGESGVGKTSFAAAVARDAPFFGLQVVTGECVPVATADAGAGDVRGAPLHPFHRLLEAIADRCRERGRRTTDQILGPRGKILAAYEPSLRHLPGQDEHPDPPEVPAQAARQRILAALREALAAFAATPVLLLLDDLQWADELSLDFLKSLDAGYFAERPLLVLGTYRSEEVGDALREVVEAPAMMRFCLDRLDEGTVGKIVSDMLAIDNPPPAFVRVLARRSAGNPFFVAEYLRAAVAERLLYRERGAWRLAAPGQATQGPANAGSRTDGPANAGSRTDGPANAGSQTDGPANAAPRTDGPADAAPRTMWTEAMYEALPLPSSLRELVGHRLDGLGRAARDLVAAAAVLGREVDGGLLVAVASMPQDDALAAVKELLSRQVLEEVRPGRFRFVHDKLREITYDRIPEPQRRGLHRAGALAIEARCAGTSVFPLLCSELAYHFTEAGDLVKAIDYLEMAGQQAERSFANREAARFFSEALSLDHAAEVKVGALRRAVWERQLGNAYLGLGKLVESEACLLRAVALLGHEMPGPLWQLVPRFLGQVGRQIVHRAREPRWQALSPGEREVLLEAARAYDLLVQASYYVTGDLLRILYATLSNLNLAERAGPSPELALAYGNSHFTAGLLPWFSLARTYGRRAHEILEGVMDPAVRSWVYVLAGAYATGVGAWEEAISLGKKAEVIAEEVGFRRRAEEALGVCGAAYNLAGDFVLGRDTSQAIYESALRGDPQTQVWGQSGVAMNCLCLGEAERALTAAERSVQCLSQKLGRPEKIFCYGVLALARLRSGHRRGALNAARAGAAAIAEGAPISFYSITAYSFVADVFLDLWEQGGADPDGSANAESRLTGAEERQALQRNARRSCDDVVASARIFPVHRPHAFLVRGRYAALSGDLARAHRLWRKSVDAAQQLRMPYDEGLAELTIALHMERGTPLRRVRLRRAIELFRSKGAAYDLSRAEAELTEELKRSR